MSMIGLLAGAPQAATAKSAGGDAAAAEGFGSTLQGALDALVEAAANHQGEAEAPPTELEQGGPGAESGLSTNSGLSLPIPVELAETPLALGHARLIAPGEAQPATSTTRMSSELSAGPETTDDSPETGVRSSATETPSGRTGSSADSGLSLSKPVEPAETPELGRAQQVSTNSTRLSSGLDDLAIATTPVDSNIAKPSAESGLSLSKPVELAETPELRNTPLVAPTSSQQRSTSATASSVPNPEGGLSLSKPVERAETTPELRQAQQVSTSSTRDAAVAPSLAPVSAPVGAPQPVAPAAAVTAPAAAASVPFATQLVRPIFSLAAAGAGEHVMTVSVTPDNLGPVTVRAHVGAEGVRVELFAPNDLGREAIRAIIPELRRDLAGAGLGGNLSLSPQNQPSADGSAHGSNAGQPGERDGRLAAATVPASADNGLEPTEQQVDRVGLFGTTSTIDVLA